jgi:hypothetical protein
MPTKIIIDRTYRDGEVKKYRSTQEEIQHIRRENDEQRRRDELARSEALRNQDSSANRNAHRAS